MEENKIERVAFRAQKVFLYLNAPFTQKSGALSAYQRVWVSASDNDFFYSGFNYCLDARRLLSCVAAGFQRDEHVGAACVVPPLAAVAQSIALGVQVAVLVMIALAYDLIFFYDDGADQGIGICPAFAFFGKLNCRAHKALFRVVFHNSFFHPDFTVGRGISPRHALASPSLAGYTAGGELRPALKFSARQKSLWLF